MAFWPDDPKKQSNEHREGPDLLAKWAKYSGLVAWAIIFLMLIFIGQAKPQIYTVLDAKYNKISRNTWDQAYLIYAFICAGAAFIFSLISLLINSRRIKRKTDRIKISLLISLLVSSIATMAFFLWYVGTL